MEGMPRKRDKAIQCTTEAYIPTKISKVTQIGGGCISSYSRKDTSTEIVTYDDLVSCVLFDKCYFIDWLTDKQLIAGVRICSCGKKMNVVKTYDRTDPIKFECRSKGHRNEISIRKNSWFSGSNLTMEEIIKITYWWTAGLTQQQIRHQVRTATNTSVDWDMFHREACEVYLMDHSEMLGGVGVRVQIDESKFGKR